MQHSIYGLIDAIIFSFYLALHRIFQFRLLLQYFLVLIINLQNKNSLTQF
jgi:hypothetical protein